MYVEITFHWRLNAKLTTAQPVRMFATGSTLFSHQYPRDKIQGV